MAGKARITGRQLRADELAGTIIEYAWELLHAPSPRDVAPQDLAPGFTRNAVALACNPLGRLSLGRFLARNPGHREVVRHILAMAAEDLHHASRAANVAGERVIQPFQMSSFGGAVGFLISSVSQHSATTWSLLAAAILLLAGAELTRARRRYGRTENQFKKDADLVKALC